MSSILLEHFNDPSQAHAALARYQSQYPEAECRNDANGVGVWSGPREPNPDIQTEQSAQVTTQPDVAIGFTDEEIQRFASAIGPIVAAEVARQIKEGI